MELTSSKEPSECRRERVAWVGESDIPMLESAVTCFVCWAGAAVQQLKGRSTKDSNTIKSIFLLSFFLFRCAEQKWQRICAGKKRTTTPMFVCAIFEKYPGFPSQE
jgi:hypothetical protein